ncbi:MAG: hypothetical protein MUF86_00370 [Akkermansiaceae bacterium]|jgi:hypothetical protein|nr:hypothetical protein [Akkermansiaceae bacterium]MCU0776108.1 hypothetical protein [Akkermansiaceae bacterium]
MESEAPAPSERDFRQRRIDHAEMLGGHKAEKQRRRELHAKRKFTRSIPPNVLI